MESTLKKKTDADEELQSKKRKLDCDEKPDENESIQDSPSETNPETLSNHDDTTSSQESKEPVADDSESPDQKSVPTETKKDDTGDSDDDLFEFFYGRASPFSQWYRCSFNVSGRTYNCAEQYLMHQKALLFGDDEIANRILKASHPKKQQALGSRVHDFSDEIWKKERFDIVKVGNFAKFSQNEDLKEILLKTAPRILVEESKDRVWGIGLPKGDPKAKDRSMWLGKNCLGFALTHVRTEIMNSINKT